MALSSSLGVQNPEVQGQGQFSTAFDNIIRVGNIRDNSSANDSVGVPLTAVPVVVKLQAPAAADDDYFVAEATYDTVGAFATLLNSGTNQTNEATGKPFCRSILVTPTASTSGSILFTVEDAQGQIVERTITFAASGTAIQSAWTCRRIISAEILVGFGTDEGFKVGFDDRFGLPYPAYLSTLINAGIDADGADFPAWDATNFVVTTDYTFTPGIADSATADHYGTFNFATTDTDPDGTANYAFIYLAHEIFRRSEVVGDAYSNGSWNLL